MLSLTYMTFFFAGKTTSPSNSAPKVTTFHPRLRFRLLFWRAFGGGRYKNKTASKTFLESSSNVAKLWFVTFSAPSSRRVVFVMDWQVTLWPIAFARATAGGPGSRRAWCISKFLFSFFFAVRFSACKAMARQAGMYVAYSWVKMAGFTNVLVTCTGRERETRPEAVTSHITSPICIWLFAVSSDRWVTSPTVSAQVFGLDTSRIDSEGVKQ